MIKKLLNKLRRFLHEHEGVFCYCCKRVFFRKDTMTEQLTTGPVVRLCGECHTAIFGFWAEEE